MIALDRTITLFLFNIQNNLKIGWLVEFFGTYSLWILLAIFVFLVAKTEGERRKMYASGLLLFLLILGRGVLVEIIRYFYHRPRPFSILNITPLEEGIKSFAFPSGHTTTMFLIALSLLFFKNKKYFWTGLVLALIGSISRIMMGIHWASDILGGIILAAAVFVLVYIWILPPSLAYYNNKKEQK